MIQVTNLEAIKLILTVVSGVCWTIVYVEGIRVGFKDKSYAIPFYALALNIDMFVQRSGGEGQSLYIAVSKWLGTLAPTILFGIVGDGGFPKGSSLILVLGIFCSVFDLIYSWMLFKPEILRAA